MSKTLRTYDGVCFAWAESLPLKSILTLVGQGEYSGCMCVKEREMACWHLVNFFNTSILPKMCVNMLVLCACVALNAV